MHKTAKFSLAYCFADDTNLLLTEKLLKKINVNADLKLVVDWIMANKLSLNTSKTQLVIFKSKNKIDTKHLSFYISGQKIKPSFQVKYFGVIQQDDVDWNSHLTKLGTKLCRSIGPSSKV